MPCFILNIRAAFGCNQFPGNTDFTFENGSHQRGISTIIPQARICSCMD
ncbi:hypothetical protein ETAF_1271 [Edwardsiella tarda FL6-60]|uniref:Uncharacterized protein n=1 Tax=Edwardsiella tarda (strain FL6-60) TaxID=718251 RepID=A0A0H3DPW3_EDWTF|nr:hypothetical protein ETAF_1271 [Edwardsiella tarda FL6-60]